VVKRKLLHYSTILPLSHIPPFTDSHTMC